MTRTPMPLAAVPFDLGGLRRRSAGLAAIARCDLVEVADGPARGQRRIEISTPAGLSATIVVDRALDILSLAFRGDAVGWRSAAQARHPVSSPEGEQGLGLMRHFDGFLVTCGLEHVGLPVTVNADALAYPPRTALVNPLHGRLPAAGVSLREHDIDLAAGVIRVRGTAFQSGVFTETLRLERTLEFDLTTPTLRVIDTVHNEGYRAHPHQLLYHVNVGHPLLGESTRLFGEEWALMDRLDEGGATPGDEHVEIVDEGATPSASGGFGIIDTAHGLFCRLRTDAGTLPLTAVWRAFRAGVFALGIEPQTGPMTLAAGASRRYSLEVEIGRATDAVR